MTKHECLNVVKDARCVSAKQLFNNGLGEYITVYMMLKRLHRANLLRIYKVGSYRETFYELSDMGLARLKHFNDENCPNENCSCKD